MAAPSSDTDTTATERSLPSRASFKCSCSTSMMEATFSSTGAFVTGSRRIAVLVGSMLLSPMMSSDSFDWSLSRLGSLLVLQLQAKPFGTAPKLARLSFRSDAHVASAQHRLLALSSARTHLACGEAQMN